MTARDDAFWTPYNPNSLSDTAAAVGFRSRSKVTDQFGALGTWVLLGIMQLPIPPVYRPFLERFVRFGKADWRSWPSLDHTTLLKSFAFFRHDLIPPACQVPMAADLVSASSRRCSPLSSGLISCSPSRRRKQEGRVPTWPRARGCWRPIP